MPATTAQRTTATWRVPPVVAALLHSAAYPHPADRLRLRETHISWVILAGAFAYKIKKPVDVGFLDFSTRDRRLADCAEEVRLNRRLCPDVYLGVTWVVERDGAYAIGGPGRLVEPAVWMRRLRERGMLSSLLARNAVPRGLPRRIGHRLADFHATAQTGPGVDEHGSPAAVRAIWTENFAQVAPLVGRVLSPEAQARIISYVARFLEDHNELLARRVAGGRIRDGHGDLYAGSVCVEGRRLHLFDCLEFAARLRCADVAADLAFLGMDFEHHGRPDLRAALVDAYVRRSGDRELLRLLDFYECERAYVRGKVLSLRIGDPGLPAEQATVLAAEASAYFDLADARAGGTYRDAAPAGFPTAP